MSDYTFTVGDVVRLRGTGYIALIVAVCDNDDYYPVVEIKDDWEYNDSQNFQENRWLRWDIELLIPRVYSDEFPVYGEKGGEA